MCAACKRKTSVTAGTIFHRSHAPISTWFSAVWYVTAQKDGVSALALQRELGLGSYETAWTWLQKLRRVMVPAAQERLAGSVEIAETFVGARVTTASGRGETAGAATTPGAATTAGAGTTPGAATMPSARARATTTNTRPTAAIGPIPVMVAVERVDPKRLGRVRFMVAEHRDGRHLIDFARSTVEPGSTLRIGPALPVHPGLDFRYEPVSASGYDVEAVPPGVQLVSSMLRRWIARTLRHHVSREHLPYYLDEYTFRFNRRDSSARGMLFYRLLQQAVATEPHPLAALVRS